MNSAPDKLMKNILSQYQRSFAEKVYGEENNDFDLLMEVFGLTPELKRENRQYWGRELGMCWQRLVVALCQGTRADFGPAIREGADEPCDLVVGDLAIDTKYRIGSGDSGTLKKFKSYGPWLKERGLRPVLLVLRDDNLPAAIGACKVGNWDVRQGRETFEFLRDLTGVDLEDYLRASAGQYTVVRAG